MTQKNTYILAIDQGTSSTKAIIFDKQGVLVAKATVPLKSYYPEVGFVEQDPQEIYQSVVNAAKLCMQTFREMHPEEVGNIATCGISNQRETFVLWDENGVPLHNAVVWQCKRSIETCNNLHAMGLETEINQRTGLKIDPYFSGSKLIWLYEKEPTVKKAIDSGKAYFGTVDTWLLYKLTDGKEFLTDHTNACRTLLYNIYDLVWDDFLLNTFNLSKLNLPQVLHSSASFGASDFESLFEKPITITGMIGDSHAAAFGEGCYSNGTAKVTLGTGSSILWNTGQQPFPSEHGMVTTICWSIENRVDYALEGVIVSCGATIEWLKQQLGLFAESRQTEEMATSLESNEGVYLIPAFSGLGAPHWQMDWKASIHGLTFKSDKNHFVRAALESIPYQIKDVIVAMEQETNTALKTLNADGGITANQFLMLFLTDLLSTEVVNIGFADVSGYGAALIAGLGGGVWQSIDDFPQHAQSQTFQPSADNIAVLSAYQGWLEIVAGLKK